jgi:hypothetical protein
MQDLQAPEVPMDVSKAKSEGFLKKLFSKKEKDIAPPAPATPPLTMPEEVPPTEPTEEDFLPELPVIDMTAAQTTEEMPEPITTPSTPSTKFTGRARGKKSKKSRKSLEQIDIQKQFNWTDPVEAQENVVADSNRNNPDVTTLMEKADKQVAEQKEIAQEDTLLTEHEPVEANMMLTPPIPESHTEMSNVLTPVVEETQDTIVPEAMPTIHPEEHKIFKQIEKDHKKLRQKIVKNVDSAQFNPTKKEFRELLKQYDERIEKKIEHRELMLSDKRDKLEKFHETLKGKEKEVKNLHEYLKRLDIKLKEKETHIDTIVDKNVQKQLVSRLSKEKALLKKEVVKSITLNKALQKKLDIMEKDRVGFEKKKDKILEQERTQLTSSQTTYDKKLAELDRERKDFEKRRVEAMPLINKGEGIGKELKNLENLKTFLAKNRAEMQKELTEDRALKQSITDSEKKLYEEKENLDKLIFSKYIDAKLKNITPGPMPHPTKQDLNIEFENSEIYRLIKECKKLVSDKRIPDAKRMYNTIKILFENGSYDAIQRDMLFNTIKALYNDIQIASVEKSMKQ